MIQRRMGWQRDLVVEGIEPNPGPSFKEDLRSLIDQKRITSQHLDSYH